MSENKNKDDLILKWTDKQLVQVAGSFGEDSQRMAEAELLRRNTEALNESSRSETKYARRMMGLTYVVSFIAFLQLIYVVLLSQANFYEKVFLSIVAMGSLGLMLWDLIRDLKATEGDEENELRN